MLSISRALLARGVKKAATGAAAVPKQVAAKSSSKKVASKAPSPVADDGRFKTFQYKPGKTTTKSMFSKSFLEDLDAITGDKSTGARRKRRASPFAISTPEEKKKFERLVRRNMREVSRADIKKVTAEIMELVKKRGTGAVDDKALVARALQKYAEEKGKRGRVHSPFYSDAALRARGRTLSVAVAPKRQAQAKAKKASKTPDVMNPLEIEKNFFTSCDRKQYSRLKRATFLIRDPARSKERARRSALYRMWDRLSSDIFEMLKVKK